MVKFWDIYSSLSLQNYGIFDPMQDKQEDTQWFVSWFDTSYYHILYQDRDYKEAAAFMQALAQSLPFSNHDHVLDLACGRGRHSIYLNRLGYRVTGVDLSESSIAFAKAQLQQPKLQQSTDLLSPLDASRIEFKVHDMTEPMDQDFDIVLNLFTSFGYFENEADNLKTIKSIKKNLKPGGKAVIDFMNTPYVHNSLVSHNQKTEDGITFDLKRQLQDGFIIKDIEFTADGKQHHFTEKVRVLRLDDFQVFFDKAGLELVDLFGDYDLTNYHEQKSPRMVMVLKA